ncbi:MAG: hypothetical protein J6Q22_11135 [Prevotella sp.]|nr:hypothetical protein [Prevotella sp.]
MGSFSSGFLGVYGGRSGVGFREVKVCRAACYVVSYDRHNGYEKGFADSFKDGILALSHDQSINGRFM